MTTTKILLLSAALAAGIGAWPLFSSTNDARSLVSTAKTKWIYATLVFEEPLGADYGSSAKWITGKKFLGSTWEKDKPHPFSKLNNELAGKEPDAHLGVLLDRIGQDGWELVSYTRTEGPRRLTQTWVFKQPSE